MYEMYGNRVTIEANVLANMSSQYILPVATRSQNSLSSTISVAGSSSDVSGHTAALGALSSHISDAFKQTADLHASVKRLNATESQKERARLALEHTIPAMNALRSSLDNIGKIT